MTLRQALDKCHRDAQVKRYGAAGAEAREQAERERLAKLREDKAEVVTKKRKMVRRKRQG